jgi:hypothetical protein
VIPLTPLRTLPQEVAAACNFVGVTEKRNVSVPDPRDPKKKIAKLQHGVLFSAPSWMLTKPIEGLGAFETPNVADWFARLDARAQLAPTSASSASTSPASSESDDASDASESDDAPASGESAEPGTVPGDAEQSSTEGQEF